jgi:hypothetical protein
VTGTITLASALPAITVNMEISGPGASRLTVNGNNNQVFAIAGSGTVLMTGLTIANGITAGNGSAIANAGTLHVNDCNFSNNAASSSSQTIGGGIAFAGNLSLANSIVAGNSVSGSGTAANADIYGNYTDKGGNLASNSTGISSTIAPKLSALQYNGAGATLQTLIPLPGSRAICAGKLSNIPAGFTTDERGFPNTNTIYTGYSPGSPCVDTGAEIEGRFARNWGAVAEVAGVHNGNINSSGVGLDMVTAVCGPRYTRTMRNGKYAFFGQALGGAAVGFDSVFPAVTGATTTQASPAIDLGGGLNIALTPRIAVRAIEANWLRSTLSNAASNVQNNLRLGAGIVFRLR